MSIQIPTHICYFYRNDDERDFLIVSIVYRFQLVEWLLSRNIYVSDFYRYQIHDGMKLWVRIAKQVRKVEKE